MTGDCTKPGTSLASLEDIARKHNTTTETARTDGTVRQAFVAPLVPSAVPSPSGVNAQPRHSHAPDPLMVELSMALADSGSAARYIDPANKSSSQDSIHRAAVSGLAYFITVRWDVLGFDLDTEAQVTSARGFAKVLVEDGRPVLLVPSGREGHAHLWAVIANREDAAHWRERARARGLRPRFTMRPPGAPHRWGAGVQLPLEAVEFLSAIRAERTDTDGRLDPDLRMMHTGRWVRIPRDTSESNKLWLFALYAARKGWTFADYRNAVANPDNGGGARYQRDLFKRGFEATTGWLHRQVWAKAVDTVGRTPGGGGPELEAHLDAIDDAIAVANWTYRGGTTDRAVLKAIVARMRAWSTWTIGFSHRAVGRGCQYQSRRYHRERDQTPAGSRLAFHRPLGLGLRGRGQKGHGLEGPCST